MADSYTPTGRGSTYLIDSSAISFTFLSPTKDDRRSGRPYSPTRRRQTVTHAVLTAWPFADRQRMLMGPAGTPPIAKRPSSSAAVSSDPA